MTRDQIRKVLSKQSDLLTALYKDHGHTTTFEDKIQFMKEAIDDYQSKGDWLGVAAAGANLDTMYRNYRS